MTGEETARKVLDDNGLQNIQVKTVGSMLFGNSYSHYFKKVRLRRLTKNKTSITAMAMGAEKASLAVLDKEGDKAMKTRIVLTPFISFGPFAFVPLIVVGILIDWLVFAFASFTATVICSCAGLGFYVISFILSLCVINTEKKAQVKACEIMSKNGLATPEEIEDMKSLYKLYNVQYVNDLILSALELLYRILIIIGAANGSVKSSSSN